MCVARGRQHELVTARALAFGAGAVRTRVGGAAQWVRSQPTSPYVTVDPIRGPRREPATHASRLEHAGIRRIRRPMAVARWHDEADRGVGHETAMGQQARTDENLEPLSTDGLEVVEARDADTVRLFLCEWRRRVILDRAARPARSAPDHRPRVMMHA